MERSTKTLIITLCGLITSLATAAILSLIEINGGFAIYSLMMWFIVPIGAIASGFVAASGYYFAARWTNYRPDRIMLVSVLTVSTLTFFLLYYLIFASIRIEGIALSSRISFLEFLQVTVTNQTYTIGHTSSSSGGIQLGQWGYAVTALQILGFSLGGLIVYGIAQSQPYCSACSRYLVKKGTQSREAAEAATMGEAATRVATLMKESKLQEAIREHAALPAEKLGKKAMCKSALLLRHCPVCQSHQLDLSVSYRTKDSWTASPPETATTSSTLML